MVCASWLCYLYPLLPCCSRCFAFLLCVDLLPLSRVISCACTFTFTVISLFSLLTSFEFLQSSFLFSSFSLFCVQLPFNDYTNFSRSTALLFITHTYRIYLLCHILYSHKTFTGYSDRRHLFSPKSGNIKFPFRKISGIQLNRCKRPA